jgi:hypothetical protein
MQLTIKVNDHPTVKGAIRNRGVLAAHVLASVSADGDVANMEAGIHAFDFGLSGGLEWSAGRVSIGDKIEIHVLPDHDADLPTKTSRSADYPAYLFSDPRLARQALAKAQHCKELLEEVLQAAKNNEPHEEALKIQRAVIAVVQQLGQHLISPTIRRHPELLSETSDLLD